MVLSAVPFTAVGMATTNPRTSISWSNRFGVTLTPISGGIWAAERPFIWNNIDVGGRSVIARMKDGSLLVHSPVEWTESLGESLSGLGGDVKHIISPNYEHLKYAQQWSEIYPSANIYGCPGLSDRMPEVDWTEEITYNTPSSLSDTIESLYFDCELNPFTGNAFFNEIVFFHKPTQTLFMSDVYWNYPSDAFPNHRELMEKEGTYVQHECSKVPLPAASSTDTDTDTDSGSGEVTTTSTPTGSSTVCIPGVKVPLGTKLWKLGMDRVYKPFYQRFMVGKHGDRRDRYNQAVERMLQWEVCTIVPCHGDVIRGRETCRRVLNDFFLSV